MYCCKARGLYIEMILRAPVWQSEVATCIGVVLLDACTACRPAGILAKAIRRLPCASASAMQGRLAAACEPRKASCASQTSVMCSHLERDIMRPLFLGFYCDEWCFYLCPTPCTVRDLLEYAAIRCVAHVVHGVR